MDFQFREIFVTLSLISASMEGQLTSYSLNELNTSNSYSWSTAPWITSGVSPYPTGPNAQANLSATASSQTIVFPVASLTVNNDVSNLQISDLSFSCSQSNGSCSIELDGNSITTNSLGVTLNGSYNSITVTAPLISTTSNVSFYSGSNNTAQLNQFTNLSTFTLSGYNGDVNVNDHFLNFGTLSFIGIGANSQTSPIVFNVSGPNFVTGNSNVNNSNLSFSRASQLALTGTLDYSHENTSAVINFNVDNSYANATGTSSQSNSFVNITGTPTVSNYGLFLTYLISKFNINVTNTGVTSPGQSIQLMNFPERYATDWSVSLNYSSPGLTTADGFPTYTTSLFDTTSYDGSQNFSLILIDDPNENYTFAWSDITPAQWAQISGTANNYSGSGYSTFGVNGVFGLWVDAHNKHHTVAHIAGTNSPNNTATNLNTMKKSNQMQLRSEAILDISDTQAKSQSVAINDIIFSEENLIAQQSMVQQLAERNLQTSVKHWSVYVEPRGSWGQIYKQKNHLGNTFQTAGTRVGFDYLWTNEKNQIPVCVGLGFVADYIHLWGQRKHHSGNFYANEGLGNAYLTVVPKAVRELSFNLITGGGYSWYTFHRDLFENSKVIATGKSKGPEADLFFEIEYVFRHQRFIKMPKDFRIAPIAALQYTYSKVDAYKETGAGRYNLKVNTQDASTLSTLFGFRSNYEFRAESSVSIRPELLFLWQYQYLDPSITSTSNYLTSGIGPDLITSILPGMPRNTWIVGANLRFDIYNCAQVQLDYDFLYNSGFVNNAFFLEIKGQF